MRRRARGRQEAAEFDCAAIRWAESEWVLPDPLHPDGKAPIVLRSWQKAVLFAAFPDDGPSEWETFLISTVKKGGKTTLNAIATTYAALTFPAPERALVVANDRDQAEGRVFRMIADWAKLSGREASGEIVIRKSEIEWPETGTKIVAIPCDATGEAGDNFGISSWTEVWGFEYEAQVRLWDELTPIPARRSIRLVDSYAGYDGRAPVLIPLWESAIKGVRVEGELPIYTDGRLWALIDQGEEAQARAWRDDESQREGYYAEQKRRLRPAAYNRLHLNLWQTGEEAFVTSDQWNACIRQELRPVTSGKIKLSSGGETRSIFLGIDGATKRDCSAVVAVAKDGDRMRLVCHKIWTPSPGKSLDLEETVEAYILELNEQYTIERAFYDAMQLERSIKTLRKKQVRGLSELTQGLTNLGSAAQVLYDLVIGEMLDVYGPRDANDSVGADIRQHVVNAVASDGPHGWKLDKQKQRLKIDGAVALSFAVLAATRKKAGGAFSVYAGSTPQSEPVYKTGDLVMVGEKYIDLPPREHPGALGR